MLIELAHYTLLFALTVVGFQTFLLTPTLWSGGSAVTIKLGFRGACFTITLLLFTFLILLRSFVVHDFSLAIVFENFDSQSSLFYVFQAFCASREGFFFSFIVILSITFLIGFSKSDLATYQERGRYLFSGGCLIFSLLCLMLTTADPFVRIENPPFEGIGFNPLWRSPYRILFVFFSFAACATLTVSFIKTICMCSKGRQFVFPTLKNSLWAMLFLLGAFGIKIITDFTTAENNTLWQWSSENALLVSVLLLVAGQILLLFFYWAFRIFTNWIVFFSLLSTVFTTALFLMREYRLITLSSTEIYFPNPLIALYAFAGLFCFLLFLCSVTLKTPFKENSFPLFSRESFIGLTAAALLSAGISIGLLSLLPSLLIFLPDLPLRLLPALFKTILFWSGLTSAVCFFVAFKRKSTSNEWIQMNKKNLITFWTVLFIILIVCCYTVPNGYKVVFHSVPGILIFASLFDIKTVKIPASFQECLKQLKKIPKFKYGVIFSAVGFLIFSVTLSYASFNHTEIKTDVKIEDGKKIPALCSVQQLSEKNDAYFAKHRLICPSSLQLLSGSVNFQWQEAPMKAKFLQTTCFSTRLIQIDQNQEDILTIRSIDYPLLQSVGSGLFLMCLGVFFMLLSVKKEKRT